MNADTFWMQVGTHNEANFPFQAILVVAVVILAYLAFAKPSPNTDTGMKAFFAFAFVWNEVVIFLIFAKSLKRIAGTYNPGRGRPYE